jgi:hypothetical protein
MNTNTSEEDRELLRQHLERLGLAAEPMAEALRAELKDRMRAEHDRLNATPCWKRAYADNNK